MGVGGLGGTKDYEMRALLTNTDKQYCWLDQNLGSVGAPAFSTDYHSRYFFQWGNSNVAYTVHSDHTVSPSEPSHTERPDSWNGDPCRKLLGPRWRLPVRSEMDAIFATYGINSPESAYNSLNLGADGWYAQSESHGYDFRLAHRGSGFKFYFLRDGYMRAEQGKTYGNITSYDRHCMPVRCISEDIWR